MKLNTSLTFFILLCLSSCITVPKQAPSLSEELGRRLTNIEQSHLALLHSFFQQKRGEVDEFLYEEWVPAFTRNFFANSTIEAAWDDVVKSEDKDERMKFLLMVGPRLQSKIAEKRIELIKPLDDLEKEIELKIQEEYNLTRSINNTITSFLYSASKVNENRQRYLDMLGITDEKIAQAIDKTDEVVQDLVSKATDVLNQEGEIKNFIDKVNEIKAGLK